MSDEAPLQQALSEGVLTLTLDRPEKRNSLNAALVAALDEALDRAATDPEVRVVILTGAGERAFCAGGDLGEFGQALANRHGGYLTDGRYAGLLSKLRRLPRPAIAAVNGVALGGGFGLAAACDLVIASEMARFGAPELDVGMFPMMIAAPLTRLLPPKRLFELFFTGVPMAAAEALSWGLVNRVVAPEALQPEARELAHRLAARSPSIMALGKQAFYCAQDLGHDEALAYLQAMKAVVGLTRDSAEGVAAFLEKRSPHWTGR